MKKIFVATLLCTASTSLFAQEERKFNDTIFLQPVEGYAIRAADKGPFTKTNLNKKEIEKNNIGQDLPFILNQTPSMVVNSDAGNGVGYTGMRIRGTDATRINVTVNGIPYNDAESQGTYFVDMPDIASSLNSIQIQRGVGTSSNGAGAFGASVNLITNEFIEKAYGEVNNSYGSFNTWKNTVKAGTGLINKHFTIDTRLSRVASDGFIDRASSNLKSFYLSGAYVSNNTSLRFNIISGNEATYQAWNGIPEHKLFFNSDKLLGHYYNNLGYYYFNTADSLNLFNSDPRKFNMFTYNNQTDNYKQDHYQVFLNHKFKRDWTLNIALFLSKGKGYYEELRNNAHFSDYGLPDIVINAETITKTNLVRQLWLDNSLYGTTFSLTHKFVKGQFVAGGAWNEYDGKHYGNIVWANIGIPKDHQWYHHTAYKKDLNLFAKYQYKLSSKLEALADLQYRRVDYLVHGTRKYPDLEVKESFNFFNPKFGLTYSIGSTNAYVSYAVGNKEPNRNDYETGGATTKPKREQLHDIEAGVERARQKYNWAVNFYYMKYKDQLVLTGKINDVGDPVRINVPNSYRLGIELQGGYKFSKLIQVSGNIAFSQNKIRNFNDYMPHYDVDFNLAKQDTLFYAKTDLAFSPTVVGSGIIQIFLCKNAEIDLISKYVSDQYLDNTTDKSRSIKAYFVQDVKLKYTLQNKFTKEISFVAQVNNILNRKYESNGYTYSYLYDQSLVTENFYFPMAGTNCMFSVNIKL